MVPASSSSPVRRLRFAAQVAFEQWVRQGYWSVAAVFEDRHDVVVLGAGGQLLRKSVPVKRTQVRKKQDYRVDESRSSVITETSPITTPSARRLSNACAICSLCRLAFL